MKRLELDSEEQSSSVLPLTHVLLPLLYLLMQIKCVVWFKIVLKMELLIQRVPLQTASCAYLTLQSAMSCSLRDVFNALESRNDALQL